MSAPLPISQRLYFWLNAHPRGVDIAIMLAVLLVTVTPYALHAAFSAGSDTPQAALLVALCLALVVPLAWRRSHPVGAAAAILLPCLVQVTFGIELLAGQFAVLVIISALAAYGPVWASRAGLALGVVGIALVAFRYTVVPDVATSFAPAVITLIGGWAVVGVAWLLGDVTRSRRSERDALADRAERLIRERQRDRELAAADERAHIAREMHDIVAHSLSIIVTQADGARYAAPPNAGPVIPALEAIAETARTSLSDMRRLLGVLHSDEPTPTAPSPGIADIEQLIASVRASGLPVRYRSDGDDSRPAIAQGAELVVFRMVQESLTNVLKHAGSDAHAEVDIDWGDDAVEITVRDTGRGLAGGQENGSGNGLHGMRERLALYDGALTVDSPQDGGVTLHARLPYASAVTGA
ncbi:sensor histidine kinase [Amnibacterium flavum]|uniref:histidine kinase n=1 Tax=Amnibacterium flavum TaxID=2173173 RepID=A0A2V1HNH9_9MICO|nr:histidine kinase [Amnibacterium flavum]PVZ93961.1 two-component sensor histidine kinase [Amnibacterium flavum]